MHPALTFQFERAVNEYAQWQAVRAEDRSDAPAWWWDTAIAADDETATMPVEWCATLGVADESTYAKGAEVFRNALVGQTYLPRKAFRQVDAKKAMTEHEIAQKAFATNRERLKAERLAREAAAPAPPKTKAPK